MFGFSWKSRQKHWIRVKMISKIIYSNISNILRVRYVQCPSPAIIYFVQLKSLLRIHIYRYQPLCRIIPTVLYSTDDSKNSIKTNKNEQENTPKVLLDFFRNNSITILTIHWISFQRPSYGLRRKNLLPYPPIEVIDKLSINNFLSSNFKTIKHGDYEFTECLEGFVHIYATSYQYKRDPHSLAGYSVYYGSNHPL